MNRLVATNQKTNAIIIGWCSFQKGGRITNVKPEGYESHGEGDGWDEEQWCYHTVESALGVYNKAYEKLNKGYGLRASKQMRDWLQDIFWDAIDMRLYQGSEPLVVLEVSRFREMVETQAKTRPRLKTYEVA
jgi:hypothetical protein